ncbi:MAG: hypothetical protein GY774_39270 [Planctomycetes bacterium]|nr:hypothetical protein [Planctomycetota bacterium]
MLLSRELAKSSPARRKVKIAAGIADSFLEDEVWPDNTAGEDCSRSQ